MPGPSGYSAAFSHPDPRDPNDDVRQRPQSRAGDYPYDQPVSYGGEVGTDLGGAAYQNGGWQAPPVPVNKDAEDEVPKNVWERLSQAMQTYEPGPQAPDAAGLSYGGHGRLGDGIDPMELDVDALRKDFMSSFMDSLPQAKAMGRTGLFALLVDLDPEYSAELFAPEDDDEMTAIYGDWGQRVYAPGAEEDEDEDLDY